MIKNLRGLITEETINIRVARMIYDARNKSGTDANGTRQARWHDSVVIARLEDADYDGHSLNMVTRVAAALNKRVDIRF